ncbi:hypothetical protein NDU88_003727 [Pleurodeles waltl]|uniref:Uncharacterized protein n=1 Tax=Pleurodeles waltl TaxID=8319 RepID=A0AAV7LG91_PLEWA|nr:hypothetical protein NDU88_003727 [Pleurodeles waltl]
MVTVDLTVNNEVRDSDAAAAVGEALRVICEAGRDDLIQQGVLSQAWVGLECLRRAAAGVVVVADLACSLRQQLVSKIVNARCLGGQKRKMKKKTTLCWEAFAVKPRLMLNHREAARAHHICQSSKRSIDKSAGTELGVEVETTGTQVSDIETKEVSKGKSGEKTGDQDGEHKKEKNRGRRNKAEQKAESPLLFQGTVIAGVFTFRAMYFPDVYLALDSRILLQS